MVVRVRPRFDWKQLFLILLVLAAALALRLYKIGAESFWYDEVISYENSQGGPLAIARACKHMAHPLLYYESLYLWRQAFGDSDARIRSYSVAISLVGLLSIFLFARDIGGRRAAWIAYLLAAVNPLDVYFAQEARNYTQVAVTATLGSWALWRWLDTTWRPAGLKDWAPWAALYAVLAAATIFTHYVAIVVLAAQGLFALGYFARRRLWVAALAYAACALAVAAVFLPWYCFITESGRGLYGSRWIKLVALDEYFSFLGREFIWGQVWTIHERWWIPTMILPVSVLAAAGWLVARGRSEAPDPPARRVGLGVAFLFWLLAGSVVVIAVLCAAYNPIYFRPRFSRIILPFFLILAGIVCGSLRRRAAGFALAAVLGAVTLTGTIVQHATQQKVDWKDFARVWRKEGPPARIVFMPLFYLPEAAHAIGMNLQSTPRAEMETALSSLNGSEVWVCMRKGRHLDRSPRDSSYYQWLMGLGSVRAIPFSSDLNLQGIRIGEPGSLASRFDRWRLPVEIPGEVEGFTKSRQFHAMEVDSDGRPFRWSQPMSWFCLKRIEEAAAIVLSLEMARPAPGGQRPELKVFVRRGDSDNGLFDGAPVARIDDYQPGAVEIAAPVPPGSGPLWIGWTVNGVNLARAGISNDDRNLGVLLRWIGVLNRSPDAFRGRFSRWDGPDGLRGGVEGLDDPARFHALEARPGETPFRWSQPKAWLRLNDVDGACSITMKVEMIQPAPPGRKPDLKVFVSRSSSVEDLFRAAPAAVEEDYRPGAFEIVAPAPEGKGPLWIGWTVNGQNPARSGSSSDNRDLGLRFYWLGLPETEAR